MKVPTGDSMPPMIRWIKVGSFARVIEPPLTLNAASRVALAAAVTSSTTRVGLALGRYVKIVRQLPPAAPNWAAPQPAYAVDVAGGV